MANTFELIASSTVGSGGAASIDFSSIPSTYKDLCLKVSLRSNRTSDTTDNLIISYNGLTTNLSFRKLEGSGSAASSGNGSTGYIGTESSSTATASTFSNSEIYIPNYAGSNYKSASSDSVDENNNTYAIANLVASLWSATSAINQITLKPQVGTLFLQYSTAYLYGVKNA
jgi:hypothetical protein